MYIVYHVVPAPAVSCIIVDEFPQNSACHIWYICELLDLHKKTKRNFVGLSNVWLHSMSSTDPNQDSEVERVLEQLWYNIKRTCISLQRD